MMKNGHMKLYVLAFAFYAVSTFIVTFPLSFHLSDGFYGPLFGTDSRGAIWHFWWLRYSDQNHLNPEFTHFLSAPFGMPLSFLPSFWFSAAIVKAFSVIFVPLVAINIITLSGFVLTGFFIFLTVYFLTGHKSASILAGFIFTFSPFHIVKTMEFSIFFQLAWLAVFLWTYVFMMTRPKNIWAWVISASFAFSFLMSFNPYYAFMVMAMMAGGIIFDLFYGWRALSAGKRLLRAGRTLLNTFCVLLISALLNLPTMLTIIKNLIMLKTSFYGSVDEVFSRSFSYLTSQSARPLSYFLPASTHPYFGGFTQKMFGTIFYGRGPVEQTLYCGWVVLLLAFFAFRQWKLDRVACCRGCVGKRDDYIIGFCIFSAILAFLFSMPPEVDLIFFKIHFPSYFIYPFLPMFRAYARFGIIVLFCVSILAAFGYSSIMRKFTVRWQKILFTAAIFSAIMFEFYPFIPQRFTLLNRVPGVYSWLKQQPGDIIIIEYPIVQGSPGEAYINLDYLYYQTLHNKRLVNGARSRTKAYEVKNKLLKIMDMQTPAVLKSLGVDYIIFHPSLYETGAYKENVDIVGEVPDIGNNPAFYIVKKFDDALVLKLKGAGNE